MSDLEQPPEIPSRRLPGRKRLGLLSVYFTLSGLLAVLAAFVIKWPTGSGERVIVFLSLALGAFGCLRAARLLRQRRKAGAQLAAVCLAISIANPAHAPGFNFSTLAIPLLGFGLLASVWEYLE
jgi:hypothetical protein